MKNEDSKFDLNINFSLHGKKGALSREKVNDLIDKIYIYGEVAKQSTIKLSFLVIAYNEGDLLIRCIDSIFNQNEKEFEVIVVDNGLDQKTKEKLKKYQLTHIVTVDNIGCCGGRNIGSVFCKAPIIAFIDGDGYVSNDFAQSALGVMMDKNLISARGRVESIKKESAKFVPSSYDLGDKRIQTFIDTEGNSIWRRDDFIKVGGFEEDLVGGEGLVLCYRMVEFYGYTKDQFIYDPSLVLFHAFSRSRERLYRKIRRNIISNYKLSIFYPFLESFKNNYLIERNKHTKKRLNLNMRLMTKKIKNDFNKIIIEENCNEKSNLKKNIIDPVSFTVVIPCYKLGNLIDCAVNSVLQQSLGNIEIIVIDDASPDLLTKNKLIEIENLAKVVRLKENHGVAHARNIGIKMAQSKYVLCLDADDTIVRTYLEKAKNIFDTYENVGIVSCGLKAVGNESWEWMPKDKIKIFDMLADSPLHTASCFRKELSIKAGMYDEDMSGYEDWNHWISIVKNGCEVRVIPELLFYYFTRPDSKVKTSNKNIENLLGKIIQNHQKLYDRYYKEIIIHKHKEIVERRSQWKSITGFLIYRIFKYVWKKAKRIKDKYILHGK